MNIDYIIGSGIFGHRMGSTETENYTYIDNIIMKAFDEAKKGISFDFISDKIDVPSRETDFHASPSKILDMAYKYSRNVVLDNTSMPFEFTITIP